PSADAAGLNPLLQHPMMLIHPPMLFLGYALLAVPYAITLGALADRAREMGMRTLREDGIRKAQAGLTTLDEVIHATVGDVD
ncbi:MAG TPA: hypothetical protein PKW12_04610, partial [Verrucomicrobiota bacterium]|nr:hypothetical protein [Verrucomicrobiota bacterium]